MAHKLLLVGAICLFTALPASAQDSAGAIEGAVTDPTGAVVPAARVTVKNLGTGLARETTSGADGFYRILALPVGAYVLGVESAKFARFEQQPIQVSVNQTARVDVRLSPAAVSESVTVRGHVQLVDSSSTSLGRVVTGREIVDLPLNGRNFTQLGLLQAGVAPLTAGVATAGGTLRQGQAYAVNGTRPEQNVYLVDGAQNINRMDGGYALKLPVDAIAEFRILTQTAPPEYGGTGGATTSVVTRSGSNQTHSSLYEFLRHDVFDARNFFSADVEPLKQHQFGGTASGPVSRDRLFVFGYYEGFRNRQGITTTATVPSPGQREGDFSDLGYPLLNIAAGGTPFPGNIIPAAAINPVARNVVSLYPLGNVSPTIYRDTLVGTNHADQAGGRLDVNASASDQIFARYSFSGGNNINPVSVRGTDVPGLRHARRSEHALGRRLRQPHFLAGDHQLAARQLPAAPLLLRSAAEPDAAFGARLRLHLGERRGPGAAVLQHQRLHADRRRDHRSAQLDAADARSAGRTVVDEGDAPRQDGRRLPADRDRHVPGDRAERVLRLRRDVPDQQRRREPGARRAGDVLPRARRLHPRAARLGRLRLRAGRMAPRIEADAELRSPLRAD